MSELKQRLQDDMKAAMRDKSKLRLTTVRQVLAAIKQLEIDRKITLDDAAVTDVLSKLVKQRKEAITQYTQANRSDLADKEQAELDIIQTYLPAMLTEAEVEHYIDEVIAATGASTAKDIGSVMGQLKAKLGTRADLKLVSQKVKSRLSN